MPKHQIESIQITPLNYPVNGLVAFALVKYAGLILSSIGIYTLRGKEGYRITYPTKKAGSHDRNVYNPYSSEVSKYLEESIIDYYIKNYVQPHDKVKLYGSNNLGSTSR
jgi:DNA-binding cell septation regulator SpoVG